MNGKIMKKMRSLHPDVSTLALMGKSGGAGGDLPFWTRWKIRRHVKQCASCQQEAEAFHQSYLSFRREADQETLTSFEAVADWTRMEREMLGNIRVGVSAGRAIDHVGEKAGFWHWKGALGVTFLMFVVMTSWLLNIPREQTDHLLGSLRKIVGRGASVPMDPIVSTTDLGIVVRSQGSALTILNPSTRPAAMTVSGVSSVRARYVDEDTGQVTITNVYGQ